MSKFRTFVILKSEIKESFESLSNLPVQIVYSVSDKNLLCLW